MRKSFSTIFFAFCLCIFAASVWYVLGTSRGSRFAVEKALITFVKPREFAAGRVSGTLLNSLVYEDVVIKGAAPLPAGSVITLKRFEICLSFRCGFTLKIYNGTAEFPCLEPVLFYGTFQHGELDVNAYTRTISVADFCSFWSIPTTVAGEKIAGMFKDVDLYFTGKPLQPLINGTFSVEKLYRADISFTKGEGTVDLMIKDRTHQVGLYGTIDLKGGVLSNPRTASVSLQDASFTFSGMPENVSMKIRGISMVEQVKIFASLEGTFDKPELKLTSDPSYAQDRLLVMLATNKVWNSLDRAQSQDTIPPGAVIDFLDYFVFGGAGKKLSNSLGVSDFAVTFEHDKKGISLKKDLTGSVGATFEVQQKSTKEGVITNSQKVGGEYKISQDLCVGAQQEVSGSAPSNTVNAQTKPEQKVYLKFKRAF